MNLIHLALSALLASQSPAISPEDSAPRLDPRVRRLATALRSSGSARDLALSTYLTDPDWEPVAQARKQAADGERLRKAAATAPDDPIAQMLWASADDRRDGCDDPHPCPERRMAFARLQPDNAAAWGPVLGAAEHAGDLDGVDAALAKMAVAKRFDDLYVEAWQAWREILQRVPVSEPELRNATSGSKEDLDLSVATSYAALLPLGGAMVHMVHACDRERYPKASPRRFEDCARLGRLMANDGTSMISAAIGHAIVRRSGLQTDADRAAERQYRWRQGQWLELSGRLGADPAAEWRLFFADLVSTGNELRAQELMLSRHALALAPPADWKDPRQD